MILYGSHTSPYVRRLRLWLDEQKLDYEYIHIDIFSPEGRATLSQHNPTKKIPFLLDGEETVVDSGVIYRYLSEKFKLPKLSWQQENILTTINAANDSLIELLLCQRSGFNTDDDKLFFKLQKERVATILSLLNEQSVKFKDSDCSYIEISLYCLLDWILFRNLWDLQPYSALLAFHHKVSETLPVAKTDPRNYA